LGETEKNTIGVLLLNLGGPDSLQAVRPFLYNLFSDRSIIKLGPLFLQKPIAWLISGIRAQSTKKIYNLIGGKSPILDITTEQAKALEEALNSSLLLQSPHPPFTKGGQGGIKVYVGMRYWHPFIDEVVPKIYNDGIRKLIVLSLYPHYSRATTGSALSQFKEVVSRYPVEIFCISSWFDHPLYIDALVDVIKRGMESFYHSSLITHHSSLDVHVLFSAHSLPESFIAEGDPYVYQIQETIKKIVKIMNIEWHLSYQSKSGPVKWLEPSTEEMLEKFAEWGYRNMLVVPISFVSDHIETLYEIDILYKDMAQKKGITLKRAESLNTHPLFIEALKDIVIESVKEIKWV
jgi:ferrochelatase